jgi:hypothetical protein
MVWCVVQERKRIEAVRRRQEKELQRMIEGEKNTSELHKKLVQVRANREVTL